MRHCLCYTDGYMRRLARSAGFALPTVVIVGTVLFGVMVVVLGSTSSVRTTLDTQFYEALARDAAESGAVHAKACMGNTTFTSGAVTITPKTDCAGLVQAAASLYIINNTASVPAYRTSYAATVTNSSASGKLATVTSFVEVLRSSNSTVWKSYTSTLKVQTTLAVDAIGDRASQRYWYFGKNAGLDFGASGSALPTTTISPGGPTFKEGSTVISDQNGNLQFYSDGLAIWNKNGAPMAGSTSPSLLGASSATQAVVAFPLDALRTRYGVVSSTGQVETGLGELYLHIIDMKQNGGLGAVISKNARLGIGKALGVANSYNGNNADKSYASEGLGAMPKADGSGYFVYTYSTARNRVTGFLINIDGTENPTPITWTMNPVPPRCAADTGYDWTASGDATANAGTYGYGSVSFTRDYSKMLLLAGSIYCGGTITSVAGQLYYFDVNGMTGALTKKSSWTMSSPGCSGCEINGYNADFSPGEGYVYVSQIYPTNILRYSLANLTSVASSKWEIGSAAVDTGKEAGGYIRRGPDGRMYIANRASHWKYTVGGITSPVPTCKMSYINTPDAVTNTTSAIGWSIDAITLGPADSGPCSIWGLPQTATVYIQKVTFY